MSVWLLPENIADMLPREARAVESLRNTFLKLVESHGVEFIRAPLIEYAESLLTGTGSDLDLRTFKIVDQVSGKTLAIRADITPQAARIDAHILNRPGVTRLCYAGSVLHARPLHPMASREPYVAGVECFGSKSKESDLEVISLGVEALKKFGLKDINLDLGHTGVAKAILSRDPASKQYMDRILYALSHKDRSSLEELAGKLWRETVEDLIDLTVLFGDKKVLDEIEKRYNDYPEIAEILTEVRWLGERSGADKISFDFADVHGYQYLTGVTFGVHVPGRFQAILRGGRYDDIGAKFGRNRPAVGFTIYLREISSHMETKRPYAILAPSDYEDQSLAKAIRQLREDGQIVVQLLPEDNLKTLEESFRIDEELIFKDGAWTVDYRTTVF